MSLKINWKPTYVYWVLKKLPKCLWKWTQNPPMLSNLKKLPKCLWKRTQNHPYVTIQKNSQKVCENSLIWVRCVKIPLLFYYIVSFLRSLRSLRNDNKRVKNFTADSVICMCPNGPALCIKLINRAWVIQYWNTDQNF